jgi:hypothetical protein
MIINNYLDRRNAGCSEFKHPEERNFAHIQLKWPRKKSANPLFSILAKQAVFSNEAGIRLFPSSPRDGPRLSPG